MYTITKEFSFCASHKLKGLPNTHPCSNLHGHNYIIKVELKSDKLDDTGFILDYRSLDVIKNWLNNTVDHKNLNDVLPFNPTAENMAYYFFGRFKMLLGLEKQNLLFAVEVSETPKTNARFQKS